MVAEMVHKTQNMMLFLFIFFIISFVTIMVYHEFTFEDKAEEKCDKIDMELFDYSSGGLFSAPSITCWDPITKETRIIE